MLANVKEGIFVKVLYPTSKEACEFPQFVNVKYIYKYEIKVQE